MTSQNPDPHRKDVAHKRAGQEESEKPADYELWRAADEASAAALALLRQVPQLDEILRRATSEEFVLLVESHGEIIKISLDLIGQAAKLLLREPKQKPQDLKSLAEHVLRAMKSQAAVPKESDDSERKV
jgi:hypothetical protein